MLVFFVDTKIVIFPRPDNLCRLTAAPGMPFLTAVSMAAVRHMPMIGIDIVDDIKATSMTKFNGLL